MFVFSIKKSSFSIIKKKKKGSLSLSTADLKIVDQRSLSTSKNYQISFWSLFFFVFFHFFFISSRSDHNFIPVYPKFIRKVEVGRSHSNLKIRSCFSEPYGPTTVRCLFPVERFLKLKKPQNWAVQGFPGRTVRFGPDFKTLVGKGVVCVQFFLFFRRTLNILSFLAPPFNPFKRLPRT